MTYEPGTRVRSGRRLGTAQTFQGLDHRTLVKWDDKPDVVQFVDDDQLEKEAQGVLL